MMKSTGNTEMVIFITSLGVGGAETALYRAIISGAYDDYNITVVSLTTNGFYGDLLTKSGIRVISLNFGKFSCLFRSIYRYLKIHFILHADIVHSWMYHANLLSLFFAKVRFRRVRCIWSVRHSLSALSSEKRLTKFAIQLSSKLSSLADCIIFNSVVSMREHLSIGFNEQNSMMIPNGFDTYKLDATNTARANIRSQLNIPFGGLVIGHVGRYHFLKNHNLLLDTFLELSHSEDNIHLVFVGDGVNKLRQSKALLSNTKTNNRIHLIEEYQEVQDVMSSFDIFCLCSTSESFPNVLAEAMACSLPCVSTNCGDSKYIIDDSHWIVPVGDKNQLLERLRELIKLTTVERADIGQRNRQKIKKNYQQNKVNKQLLTALRGESTIIN